ncbi:hypothetical protein LJR044_002284 [Microbacterium foliorum]
MDGSGSKWVEVEWTDEDLYFDYAADAPFDDKSRRLVDQIAYDPRFGLRFGSVKILEAVTRGLRAERAQAIEDAARMVYDHRVRPDLERRASVEIGRILKDPRFDVLPPWFDAPEDGALAEIVSEVDERVIELVLHSIAHDSRYEAAKKKALGKVEREAVILAGQLPQRTRDFLFFSNRIAERETAVAEILPDASPRKVSWTAYFVQRHVRSQDDESTPNRYSIAAKQMVLAGTPKKEVKGTLGVSVSRLEQLLLRPAAGRLDAADPLVTAIAELRDAPDAPITMPVEMVPERPKSVARMYVAELVELAERTADPDLLQRIVKRRSVLVVEALLRRHVIVGDLGDDVLGQLPEHFPRQHSDMLIAHKQRPLPPRTAIALASVYPTAVLNFSDESLSNFEAGGDERLALAMALRTSDVSALELVLERPERDPRFLLLIEMLAAWPMPGELSTSSAFASALTNAADRITSSSASTILRLAACQHPPELSRALERIRTSGTLDADPSVIASAVLGGYHELGDDRHQYLLDIAQQFWCAADLTVEHSLARAVVETAGQQQSVVRTPRVTYVASADAIRAYSNTDEREYTYVHLHLTAATEIRITGPVDVVIRKPSSIPALAYVRERGYHPDNPDAPDIEVIAWPLPFQPAIYSLDTSLSSSAGYFAVADGKVAVVEDLD